MTRAPVTTPTPPAPAAASTAVRRKARAFCNNEVAYIAWRLARPIAGCLGFSIVRVITSGAQAGSRRTLPSWVAFEGQSNPAWEPQDTSVWPIQSFSWRDLTLRRLRDGSRLREEGFTCHYEITPLGLQASRGTPRPPAPPPDPPVTGTYTGAPIPLFVCGPVLTTNSIVVRSDFGAVTAVFNNGILGTQNMRKLLRLPPGQAPRKSDVAKALQTKGLARNFLGGDVLRLLRALFVRMEQEDLQAFAALYELNDPELIGLLQKHRARISMILSTAGHVVPEKGAGGEERWDTTNAAVRPKLHDWLGERMQDRMFNTGRIGHNKFVVLATRADPPVPVAVLTGSTNWTFTGVAGQSNNAAVIDDPAAAGAYLAYWRRLHADEQPVPEPIWAPHPARQGPALRTADMQPDDATLDGGATRLRLWFSPNTKQVSKGAARPPDLGEVEAAIKGAKDAIFLLCFYPGTPSVIDFAIEAALARPELLVQGAVSAPDALPGEKPKSMKVRLPDKRVVSIPAPAVAQAGLHGIVAKRLLMVRASALRVRTGDLLPEVLTTGTAIVHDKIAVIDPMSAGDCVVVTGSHNLGHRASYNNDENMVILRGNRGLAMAYATHVLDVYEHYRFRAVQEERYIQALRETGRELPGDAAGGFLTAEDGWQDKWFAGGDVERQRERDYLMQG